MQARQAAQQPGALSFLTGISPWLDQVEKELAAALQAETPMVEDISTHLLRGGGKRLRPALVLLAGLIWEEPRPTLVQVAAAAELIHMATLVHDDTMDRAQLRRGVPTVHARWGDHAAILTGDYLFARAFSLLAAAGDNRAVRVMADVVFQMCNGEIEQMNQGFDPSQTEAAYLQRVYKKTAFFIAECCRLGGLLAGASDVEEQALRDYGYSVGMGFQIIDDILDLTTTAERLGKPSGSDLRSGVVTLPVIHALTHSPLRQRLAELIASREVGEREVAEVRNLVERCGGLHYAFRVADRFTEHARRSLEALPENRHRDALATMADYLAQRDF